MRFKKNKRLWTFISTTLMVNAVTVNIESSYIFSTQTSMAKQMIGKVHLNVTCSWPQHAVAIVVNLMATPLEAESKNGCNKNGPSGVFRGGTVRCPPLAWPWKFFTSDFIWKGAFLAVFQQISKKWANLRLLLNVQKQKVFQLQGGFVPLTPRPGALPLNSDGGSAPRPPL